MSKLSPWNPSLEAIRRVKDSLPAPTTCDFCQGEVAIAHHNDIFGRTYGDWPWAYACQNCDARVGIHPQTNIPLGTLADHELREARKRAKAPFQLLHEAGHISRSEAYQALADELGIAVNTCHFGWFTLKQCELAEAAAQEIYHRSFAREAEPTEAPGWFLQGAVVTDVGKRSEDVASIFEPEDFQLEWRECLVPIEAFDLAADRDGFLSGLPGDLHDNKERYQSVHDWMKDAGGVEAALQESPLLCFAFEGKLLLDDGWHRLGVAHYEYGAGELRVLCAQGLPALGDQTTSCGEELLSD